MLQTQKDVGESLTGDNLYSTRLRPAHGGGLPSDVSWEYVAAPAMSGLINRPDLPLSTRRYGVVRTDRPLTPAELYYFDIDVVDAV